VEAILRLPENAWFIDLLKHWRPAGEVERDLGDSRTDPPPPDYLRLAIRHGYVSFYCGGQCVAKVTLPKGRLEAAVHNKYVGGDKDGGQAYINIARRDGDRDVHRWIAEAGRFAKHEKRFVDRLVAHNADVIDLEACLPADPLLWPDKQAPRMDLVAIERCDDHFRLAFWEAKLVTNREVRCQNGEPKVIGQLQKYRKWLEKNRELVCEAYRRACGDLVALHRIARALSNKAELGSAIVALAAQDAPKLCVDTKPRLVIDDRKKNQSFTQNDHLAKLRERGLHVQVVGREADMMLSRPS
jgi:hypothetical protein